MKSLNIKTAIVTSSFALIALLGTSEINAQSRNQNDRFPNQSINQQKIELEKQRQYEEQVRLERERQEQMRVKYERNRNPWEKEKNVRYKVFQNGKMFVTDARGLEMLKQAVIRGYEEGFKSGLNDRKNRKKVAFNNLSMYKNANFGYQNSVELKQYQFFFQKGFSEGYSDGFNTRKFRGWYQNDGKLSEKELQAILKYERF